MSYDDIAIRWAENTGKPGRALLRSQAGNLFVHPYDDRELVSYGTHFTLARIMPDAEGNPRGWWLVNGDSYSVSTSRHQGTVRAAVARTGLPVLIVPFTVLDRASINRDSIVPVEVTADRYEPETHIVAARTDLPAHMQGNPEYYNARPRDDGRWEYDTQRHWLGASVFKATYLISEGTYGVDFHTTERTAYFLSAFDEQETRPLYFLAELPQGAHPQTVAEALEALKPPEVLEAEAEGVTVTRQGDVFAIPTAKDTRTLKTSGDYYDTKHLDYVLGVNHTATDVIEVYGDQTMTYGRGLLRHSPTGLWRAPEHKRQKMGDGKTWHLLVKNTVPDGRSWSMGGNVD